MDLPLLIGRLRAAYPEATCALTHRNPFELLVATILSAQCTDARVNLVTPALFERYPDPEAMRGASQEEIERMIRSTGFFRNKSKAIRAASQRLVEEFGGEVPRSMEELLRLPGVARKTASVVLGVAYGVAEGIVVDTHVERVSRRLGLSRGKSPAEVERDLMRLLPREQWIDFSHLLIFHGRRICQARKPKCPECPVYDLCPSARYFLSGQVPPWERRGTSSGRQAKVEKTKKAKKPKSKPKPKPEPKPKPKARRAKPERPAARTRPFEERACPRSWEFPSRGSATRPCSTDRRPGVRFSSTPGWITTPRVRSKPRI